MEPPTSPPPRHGHRRRWIWIASSLVAAVVILVVLVAAAVPLSSDSMRHRIVGYLSDRLDSDVSLGDLHLHVFPRLHAEGAALTIRQHGREDVAPLISVKSFSVDADLLGLVRKHVAHVQLEGLDIEIPPDRHPDGGDHPDDHAPASGAPAGSRVVATSGNTGKPTGGGNASGDDVGKGIVIDAMDSADTRLAIISSHPDKAPKVWNIHTLHMTTVGVDHPMAYQATLTNGDSARRDRHGRAASARGSATNRAARRSTAGSRSSTPISASSRASPGCSRRRDTFGGTLARIDANGETDTPDFTIAVGGHPFRAPHEVPRDYRRHQRRHAPRANRRGVPAVVARRQGRGRRTRRARKDARCALDVDMSHARIEDIMTMAVKTPKPPMTGALKLVTKFLLPPGDTDVVDRLQLDGRFAIGEARFTSYDVQGKINELSHRGRGKTADTANTGVVSNFEGRFKLGRRQASSARTAVRRAWRHGAAGRRLRA